MHIAQKNLDRSKTYFHIEKLSEVGTMWNIDPFSMTPKLKMSSFHGNLLIPEL